MNPNEFCQLIQESANELIIEGKAIDVGSNIIHDLLVSPNLENLTIRNCSFINSPLIFEDLIRPLLQIQFTNCIFNTKIIFKSGCQLDTLYILDCNVFTKGLTISYSEINFFRFSHKSKIKSNIEGEIHIKNNHFKNNVILSNFTHLKGEFHFSNNKIKSLEGIRALISKIEYCTLKEFIFSNNKIDEKIVFSYNTLNYAHSEVGNFVDCTFNAVKFHFVDFGKNAFFNNSRFRGEVYFLRCLNLNETLFSLNGAVFEKKVAFDNSKFSSITLTDTVFNSLSSFNKIECNTIILDQTIFENPAFFDEIQINEIDSLKRHPLRIIKQQLQRTDNRIDCNKFKVHELNAYRRELKKEEWKDRFILKLNHISSRHGTDWIQGLKFTLLIGFIMYTLYFISEFHNRPIGLSIISANEFFVGYLKYIIPSYKSSLNGETLSYFYQIIPFFLGKIFISYGIYQTIQSFRKFRI